MPPKRCTAIVTKCPAAPGSVTSAAAPTTWAPCAAAISRAARSISSWFLDEITTRTPSAASASAMARPMPRLAALTSATRPCS